VWDYAGDGYVHRLIQNKADGKLVELPSSSAMVGSGGRESGLGPSEEDRLGAEKIEAIGIEYSYLLTSQLDSQREYYEGLNGGLKGQVEELAGVVKRLEREAEVAREHSAQQDERRQREQEERDASIERDRTRLALKAQKATDLARRLEKELQSERAVSEGLMDNLTKMKQRAEEQEGERKRWEERVRELEDQVRDVMFFLEANEKIERGEAGEAAGGSVEVPAPGHAMGAGKKKKTKRG
jgi:BRCA1-associated protein